MSIAEWITQWAGTTRIAFRFEGRATTYRQLNDRIEITAQGLVAAGIAEGDRVGFCGLNRVELFETLFACSRIGAIFLPFNNRLTAAELRTQIEDSRPSLLLCTDGFHDLLGQAAPQLTIRDLDSNPFVRIDVALPDFAVSPETTVLLVYTSGTTGQAKGAMLSHDAMLYTIRNGVEHQQLTGNDCIVAPLPTFHVGGLNIQTIPTLMVGGQVVLQRRFDPAAILQIIQDHEVTQTLLVPAMLAAVVAQPTFAAAKLSSLKGINSGSSIVPAEVMQPFFDRGIPVGQVYGTTETGPTAVVLDYGDAAHRPGSCGRPAQHTELRIVTDAGIDAPMGEAGELWLRGPNIFTGYWGNAAATEEAFANGGWFRTGDVGYQDDEGYVFISDRIKDVVISGGENIYPAEVEPILADHPAIAEVAVIGRPDDKWIEIPVAVVVLHHGAALDVEELRDWCDGKLARFKHPRQLLIVDSLPRTALGKVQKHELRATLAQGSVL